MSCTPVIHSEEPYVVCGDYCIITYGFRWISSIKWTENLLNITCYFVLNVSLELLHCKCLLVSYLNVCENFQSYSLI